MKTLEAVEQEWRQGYAELQAGRFLRALRDGTFTLEHYKGFLRESYHMTGWNPRLSSLFHSRLRSDDAALVARFLKHNASEVGHDLLALADLAALGEDPDAVRASRPLPATLAFTGFMALQIEYRNPIAYLAQIYHLESLAVAMAEEGMRTLAALDVPARAQSFLREHGEADQAHMQFNRDYIERFARTEEDREALVYGIRAACRIYGAVLDAIMDEVAESREARPAASALGVGRKPSEVVEAEWRTRFARIAGEPFLAALRGGDFTLDHYRAFLRETFHNTGMNPRIGSYFNVRMPVVKSRLMAKFLKHNASEVGHNELALADLVALGGDAEEIAASRPLPDTEALAGTILLLIGHRSPLAYFGYLYHLEAMGQNAGGEAISTLAGLGAPAEAFSFLQEHAEADVAHMQFNQDYIDGFVRTPGDLEEILYTLRVSCTLYGRMLQGIMDAVAAPATPVAATAP